MNALLASNINGRFNNQQVANGSSSSILLSSVDFTVTGVMTNSSSQPGKSIIKLTGAEDMLYNGQNKVKTCDQNKNSVENYVSMNGNKEKSSEDTIPVPKVQLYTGKINVEWNQVYKIGAGLNNLGNTCFMNTVIQCLTYCPPLANYLLHDNDHSSKCTITGFCMMCLLQRHMKRAIGKTGEVIKPLDVYQRLKLIVKHFDHGHQEDAHEFLRYVIDHLWKSCLTQADGGTKLDAASKETTVINKIFGGYHRSQVICLRCKKESNTFDHFMDIILDIKQNVMSLEKALEKFTQAELLQNENSYKCPKCKMKVEAQKRFSVYRPPTVATFQLKRFDYNRSFGGKITKPVTYPEKLNLRPYMSDTQGDPVWYRLNAVLVHSGPSCNSGHYYCYVRNSNSYWYIMDDQRVHQVNLNQVLSQSAYVLFYIKQENTERTPFKKCLDGKNSIVRGNISNSHFSKVNEVNNIKTMPLVEKNSSFSSAKPYTSPTSIKKPGFASPVREKISFGFRSSAPVLNSTSTSPKNRSVTSEPVPAARGGLVPYIEDSSESSDASESNLSHNKPNLISDKDTRPLSKSGSLESYKASPRLEIRAKLSKSVFSTPSHSITRNSPPPTVSATSSWIVTDPPPTPASPCSSSTSVYSTTDWHVIDASDLKLDSPKKSESKNPSGKESFVSLKTFSPERSSPKNIEKASEVSSPTVKMTNGYENGSSTQNCNFRQQMYKNKTSFPEDKESESPFKRKSSVSYSKVSKDSPFFEHGESRNSPVPKKAKYENSSFSKLEGDVRNSGSNIRLSDSCGASSLVEQRQYSSSSNCDKNSRTYLPNGYSNGESSSRICPNKNSVNTNCSLNMNQYSVDKNGSFLKGKHEGMHLESSNSFLYKKEKLPISNQERNTSLYGTEVPTWREENHYRPTLNVGHEIRRSFDDYDNEFDSGKIRKTKTKDRYPYFHRKNPFQKYSDRYPNKYNGKFYNNHHNHRKYDNHRHWKSNHNNGYQKYHHHQHRY